MNTQQIDAHIKNKYPGAHQSPLARMFSREISKNEASRAINFAQLQAAATKAQMRRDAFQHAMDCFSVNPDHDIESVSSNVECSFPELDIDECDAIATQAATAMGRLT